VWHAFPIAVLLRRFLRRNQDTRVFKLHFGRRAREADIKSELPEICVPARLHGQALRAAFDYVHI
jgi:hypothetical protein